MAKTSHISIFLAKLHIFPYFWQKLGITPYFPYFWQNLAKPNKLLITSHNYIKLNPITFIDCTVQTLKFCDKTEKVNQGLKSQTPPYITNGDRLWWVFYIIGIRTLENGGVGHL